MDLLEPMVDYHLPTIINHLCVTCVLIAHAHLQADHEKNWHLVIILNNKMLKVMRQLHILGGKW